MVQVVEGVGVVVVVGGIGPVQSLQSLFLLLHKIGVCTGARGGHPGQPAMSPRLLPGRDGRRRWRRGRSCCWHRDGDGGWIGSRSSGGRRDWDGGAVVGEMVLLLLVVLVGVVE